VFPLSFAEYLEFRAEYGKAVTIPVSFHHEPPDPESYGDVQREFARYLRYGGFPAVHLHNYMQEEAYSIVKDIHLNKLESAFILHRCSRYDIQGKEILKTQEKFYLADTAFRYRVLGYTSDSVAAMLENVVYLEL